MPAVTLDSMIRRESGTRAAVPHPAPEPHIQQSEAQLADPASPWEQAALDRHVRERMEQALGANLGAPNPKPWTPHPSIATPPTISVTEEDPHARPTMQAVVMAVPIGDVLAPPVTAPPTLAINAAASDPSRNGGVPPSTSLPFETRAPVASPLPVVPPKKELSIPHWAVTVALIGLVMLVAAAGVAGFFWGWSAHSSSK